MTMVLLHLLPPATTTGNNSTQLPLVPPQEQLQLLLVAATGVNKSSIKGSSSPLVELQAITTTPHLG